MGRRRDITELGSKACPSTQRPDEVMFLFVACAKPVACTLAGVTVEIRSNDMNIEIFLVSLLILCNIAKT